MSTNKLSYELTHSDRIIQQMPNVIEWANKHGLKGNISRYSKYLKYIDDFYRKGDVSDLEDLEIRFNRMNNAFQECIQIVTIYEAFKDNESVGFWERMSKALYGTDFYEDTSNDPSRDFLYELLIATWFDKKGYTIDFNSNTDVIAQKNGKTIFAECKRIKSNKTFEENYKKACKQLQKTKKEENTYKLVFVDVFNCLVPNLKDYEYANIFEMDQEVKRILNQFFYIPNQGKIHGILNRFYEDVDAAIFTARRCLWIINVTPQFYENSKVVFSEKALDEQKNKIEELLS